MVRDYGLATHHTPIPRPHWLPQEVWPFPTFGVETEDTLVAVTDIGNGPPLLFVHAGLWSFLWRDVLGLLSMGFRCICMDAPGTGRSLDRGSSAITLDRAAHTVTGVIKQLKLENLTLVIHDLGGVAGLAGVAEIPERVRGIVAMNTFAWRPSGMAFRSMLALMGSRVMRELDVLLGYLPRITATTFGIGRHLDRDSRKAFLAGMKVQGRRAFHAYMRDARHCEPLYRRIAELVAGPFSRRPLLAIFGERNDPFAFRQRWKELFPDFTELIIKEGRHFPMCDAPQRVARTISAWHQARVAVSGELPVQAEERERGSRSSHVLLTRSASRWKRR